MVVVVVDVVVVIVVVIVVVVVVDEAAVTICSMIQTADKFRNEFLNFCLITAPCVTTWRHC